MNEIEAVEDRILKALEPLVAGASEDPSDLQGALSALRIEGLRQVGGAGSLDALREIELQLLRQKGALNGVLRSLGKLQGDLKKEVGKGANEVRAALTAAIEERREGLGQSESRQRPEFDVTLPGRRPFVGRLHVLHQLRDQIVDIFRGMGYSVAEGPEVEDDYHNFGALNFGPDHPARDAHDTLFLENGALLRTHTSPVQIRVMESTPPPLRMIFPGRVYRAEQVDPSHAAEFHQLEGLYVDRGVSMAHLKGALFSFARALLGPETRTRFRPSYFPFTEPSGEIDVSCLLCGGSGQRQVDGEVARCGVCKGSGWLEILGCGMVHPNVFRAVGYDPEVWTGFAFGMGFERLTMLKYGIPDVRYFLENDLRFLEQF